MAKSTPAQPPNRSQTKFQSKIPFGLLTTSLGEVDGRLEVLTKMVQHLVPFDVAAAVTFCSFLALAKLHGTLQLQSLLPRSQPLGERRQLAFAALPQLQTCLMMCDTKVARFWARGYLGFVDPMHISICIYIYVYVYIHIYTYIYICLWITKRAVVVLTGILWD